MADTTSNSQGWSRENEIRIGPFIIDGVCCAWVIWGHDRTYTKWIQSLSSLVECREYLMTRNLLGDVTLSIMDYPSFQLVDETDWALAMLTHGR
jgi:hypothetical protein